MTIDLQKSKFTTLKNLPHRPSRKMCPYTCPVTSNYRETMKYVVMGVLPNADFASFEQQLSLPTEELMKIMNWVTPEDGVLDYLLTDEQIVKIEKVCTSTFPGHLDLFLTSSE